ncbi:trypsin-like peptidase domain-containing protein [Gordonia sp. GONU]|uniref:S1C family serine protease n=1 Tax=Gordonia sp. GONU TaxID=2972949 RepID=UPI0021ACC91A|nr:trypsin-like peptidase domain-containing protein [Gordonia sp. GONU]MCR8897374.1 trypsin-like peptidase domain-containing protein [Gordonia sp. GONU]
MNASQSSGDDSPAPEHRAHPYPTAPLYGRWDGDPITSPPASSSPPRVGGVTKPIVVTALLAGLLGGAIGVGGSALLDQHGSPSAPTLSSQPANTVNAADVKPGSVTYAAQVASRSAADIKVQTARGTAVGSGIVLSQDGYVLTNHHVVAGAGSGSKITVTTSDGKQHSATITGSSPSYDLAVIKLDGASGLTPAVLGDSDALQVGEQVVAVGSPDALTNTVTSGIISALSRTVTAADESGSAVTVYNGLQTDTPINPGNSGGPLVNLQGQVVAVNSAVDTGQAASGGPQSFGLGFAIPINTAKRIANQLLQNGEATKPVLGVSGSLSSTGAEDGATVSSVENGGPAAKAGISRGDVITKVGDTPVADYADLMAQVLTHAPGETVPVTVGSGSDARTVKVKLGSIVDKQQTTVPESGGGSDGGPDGSRLPFGINPFGQVP